MASEGYGFDVGDVIMEIGADGTKWVVYDFLEGRYRLCRIISEDFMDYPASLPQEECDLQYVKVGEWDFKGDKEVEDVVE